MQIQSWLYNTKDRGGDWTCISKKLNFMYGVTGGVTQASHVSVLLSSSLDTGLVDRAADEMFTIFCHLSCDMTMLSTTGGRMAHLRHTPSTMLNTPRHIVTKQGRVSGNITDGLTPLWFICILSFLRH